MHFLFTYINQILNQCKEELYAETDEEVCVARNTLAVITYWCQGKHSCLFRKTDIEDAAKFKQFFVASDLNINNIEKATDACYRSGGSLALLESEKDLSAVNILLQRKRAAINGSTQFWINRHSAKYFQNTILNKNYKNSKDVECLVLRKATSIGLDSKVGKFF